MVSLFRSTLRIASQISSSCPSALGSVPADLSTYGRWIYSKLLRYPLLFLFRFNKRLNLIPLYQTKLSVIFCHSNQKVALLGQKAKSPQKLFCLLFKNCTYLLNSAINYFFKKLPKAPTPLITLSSGISILTIFLIFLFKESAEYKSELLSKVAIKDKLIYLANVVIRDAKIGKAYAH
jgi:hypothetical protein